MATETDKRAQATAFLGAAKREKSRRDPSYFFHNILGCRTYHKQIEMAEAVRDNPQVAVCGANGTGKDWTTGRIVHWWEYSYYPAITVIIGPTHRQVQQIVWKESRAAFNASREPLGGTMFKTPYWEIEPDPGSDAIHYAIGFSTDDEFNIQGFHSPNLLVIITEAHNMPQDHIDAVKRLNPTRLLLTGNPLVDTGEFYEAFHEKADYYHSIQISAFDVPQDEQLPGLVTALDIENHRRDWGEESPLYIAVVGGQFPDNLEDAVVPRSKLMQAVARDLPPDEGSTATLACDVARFGEDSTVIRERRGHQTRLKWKTHGRDTQQIAGKLIALCEEDESITTVIVDDVGVGGGVTDRLREERPGKGRVQIVAFNGGAAASEPTKYANAVTEAWYKVREAALEGVLDIDNDPALIGALGSRRFKYLGSGRVQLESKEEYKKRAGSSPDDADAEAMLYSPLTRPRVPNIRWI
ncbi:MAG: hypothetical protein ACE5Q6_05310 [Dehalococcoidia bacterium]